MSDPDPSLPPLPPIRPPGDSIPSSPLDYRSGPEAKSQWITDEDPRHRWFIVLLIVLFPLTLVLGVLEMLFGIVRHFLPW